MLSASNLLITGKLSFAQLGNVVSEHLALLPGPGESANEGFVRGMEEVSFVQPQICSAPGIVTEELHWVASGGPSKGKAGDLGEPKDAGDVNAMLDSFSCCWCAQPKRKRHFVGLSALCILFLSGEKTWG